jgi:hypothetical protein
MDEDLEDSEDNEDLEDDEELDPDDIDPDECEEDCFGCPRSGDCDKEDDMDSELV